MGIQHSTHPSDKILWARRKQELDLRRSGEISRSPSTQRKSLTSSIPRELMEDPLLETRNMNALNKKEELNVPPLNEEAVLKINVTTQAPDWTIPWQRLDVEFARGSGAVIEGGLVLTAAHVIANYTYIELEKTTTIQKCSAKAVGICNDLDLALLKPVDENFLKGVIPLKIGEMPSLRQRVYVAGFPIGGEEISVTEGVVSRIEVQPYSHSLKVALAVTVDAAINSGNSGGPVMNQKGELIGIAFQALEGAEAIGHIVPPVVIKHFLHGIRTFGSQYRGYPDLGIVTQTLENPAVRQYLGMTNEQSGVRVVKVLPENTCHNVLKEGDVLMKIDDYVISNNGVITFENGLHGDFTLAVQQKYAGDTLNMTILRDKQVMNVQVKLTYLKEIVPSHQYNVDPPYFVYLGLLFQPLSLDVLQSHFAGNLLAAPQELLYLSATGEMGSCTEIIVLTRIFQDEINSGYMDLTFSVIAEVNGEKVKCLRHLVEVINSTQKNEEGHIVLTTTRNALIVLPNAGSKISKKATKRINKRYHIKEDLKLPSEMNKHCK